MRPGEEFSFGRRRHSVRVVGCRHKVPCVGYCFSETRTVLTPEYEELRSSLAAAGRGEEFGRLVARRRRAGAEVDREVRRPLFAFLGDTDAGVFEENPWLFEYPVIVTECTYLGDEHLDRAERIGHTVWSRLRPVVRAHPGNLFVLTHFSLRHSDREILDFFDRELADAGLGNVVVWAHPDSRMPEQHQRGG